MRRAAPPYLLSILLILIGMAILALMTLGKAREARVAFRQPATVFISEQAAGAVKLAVTESGLYELRSADIEGTGLQVPLGTSVRLHSRGRLQPVWVDRSGLEWSLFFYGQASQSRYASENIYWLEWSGFGVPDPAPDHMATLAASAPEIDLPLPATPPPAAPLSADTYWAVAADEQNRTYNPQVESGDHWLWQAMPAPFEESFPLHLNALAPGPARLRVMVWASTAGPVDPDHRLVLRVNGQEAGSVAWDGKGRYTAVFDLPQGLLQEGENLVTLLAPGDTGAAADITFLDRFELEYPRRLVAEGDRLAFTSPGGPHHLQGFSGPVRIFDVTDPEAALRVEPEDEQGLLFTGQAGRHYLVVGPQGSLRPVWVAAPSLLPNLELRFNGADYVAIGPPDLLAALQPLLDWRRSQGLAVASIPLQAVYDQFNGGMVEPQAIRRFMQVAAANWNPAPRFLLLVGDATYDPRGYLAPDEANRLPAFLIPTTFGGETASDFGFAHLSGPVWPPQDANLPLQPDLAVGRIPARSPGQVTALVEKILAYEGPPAAGESTSTEWRRRVLAISDPQDPSFDYDAQNFLNLFPAGFTTDLLSLAPGDPQANQQIRARLNQGDLLVAYFGHGSINMWGKDRLFSSEDVAGLANAGRLPVVLNLTCLTGLFSHPRAESLAETLLWQPGSGAVAVLAPTSLTLANDQSFLSRELVESLLADPEARLGEALLAARRQVPAVSPGSRDVLYTFLLFGDPALKLPSQ